MKEKLSMTFTDK